MSALTAHLETLAQQRECWDLQATIMVVSVTASTTSGKPLSEEDLRHVLEASELALHLDDDKAAILKLVQLKMHQVAPNLSMAVGTEVAAKLMGVAGGLDALSRMPACNIQVGACAHTAHGPSSEAQQCEACTAAHCSKEQSPCR